MFAVDPAQPGLNLLKRDNGKVVNVSTKMHQMVERGDIVSVNTPGASAAWFDTNTIELCRCDMLTRCGIAAPVVLSDVTVIFHQAAADMEALGVCFKAISRCQRMLLLQFATAACKRSMTMSCPCRFADSFLSLSAKEATRKNATTDSNVYFLQLKTLKSDTLSASATQEFLSRQRI